MSKELEFVPYEEALALKELGFNKWVFAYYTNDKQYPFIMDVGDLKEKYKEETQAPLYQQAFRFFREKYKINSQIAFCEYAIESCNSWKFTFDNPTGNQFWNGEFNTYEEAELECLRKLIEIVKTKK